MNRVKERGTSKYTLLFFATIFGSAIYVGYMIFPIYYKYWDLQADFDQMAPLGEVEEDKEIRRRLAGFLREQGLKEYENKITLKRSTKGIALGLKFEEDLYLFVPWEWKEKYIKTYKFEIYSEARW